MPRQRKLVLALGIVIIGLIVYSGTGMVYSRVLVANADRTLNTVVSHENSLNTSFDAIGGELSALNGSGSFNPEQAVALVDRSVADSRLASVTIKQDDASLASSERDLDASRWLTLAGKSGVDRESGRIGHARNALAAARTIAADEVLDGRFWHALYTSLGDLDQLYTQTGAGDTTAAKSTLTTLSGDVAQATELSAAPGLPEDLHSLMVDLQTFATDYGKQLDAQAAGDDATAAQLQVTVDSDRHRLASYDIDKIGTEIDAFFRPLIDRFNSEIAAATS
jgi:hypothetical protein